jgi:hypothetical protein
MEQRNQGLLENPTSLIFLVFWTPIETWATWVYDWAVEQGRIGTVETVEGLQYDNKNLEQLPYNYLFKIL